MRIHHTPLFFLISALSLTSTLAGFKIPSHVYRTSQLSEAVAQAEKDQKALAFVYTDETST